MFKWFDCEEIGAVTERDGTYRAQCAVVKKYDVLYHEILCHMATTP